MLRGLLECRIIAVYDCNLAHAIRVPLKILPFYKMSKTKGVLPNIA